MVAPLKKGIHKLWEPIGGWPPNNPCKRERSAKCQIPLQKGTKRLFLCKRGPKLKLPCKREKSIINACFCSPGCCPNMVLNSTCSTILCKKKQKRTLLYILFLWGAVARQQKPAQHWPVWPVKKALPGVVAMGKGLGSPENGEFVSWDSLVTC